MSVELKKGQKVNLEKKQTQSLGEILINLNWNTKNSGGFLKKVFGNSAIDLDLGCLYEMNDGKKSCIQALGNAFGSYHNYPFISLDNDDRTGSCQTGENLRINGDMVSQFKRILIYTFIYEGVANWQQVNGIVTIKYPLSQDIIVKMDEYNSSKTMCAIALLENINSETFSVEKIIQFFSGHPDMDKAFHWGLNWKSGKK